MRFTYYKYLTFDWYEWPRIDLERYNDNTRFKITGYLYYRQNTAI